MNLLEILIFAVLSTFIIGGIVAHNTPQDKTESVKVVINGLSYRCTKAGTL